MSETTERIYLGMDAKLWVEGVPFTNVKDVTLNLQSGEADVSTRANSGWRAKVRTLKEGSISFQMILSSSGESNVNTILDSFLSGSTGTNQLLGVGILDSENGEGPIAEMSVMSCNRGENLEDAITYDVEMSVSKFLMWKERNALPTGSGDMARARFIVGGGSGSGT